MFFSGTGGTARVSAAFQEAFEAHEKTVIVHELNNRYPETKDEEDILVVLYPVHACNAPEAVYEYIEQIPRVENKPSVVISVSGGGEITPNTACRLHCIKRLEKKGFKVIYEKMLVMPSNWVVPTVDGLAIRLLQVLPIKVKKIVADLLQGVSRRTKPNYFNRILSGIGELEKLGARRMGKRIKYNDSCNGCGWCERNCPRSNITLENSRPHLGNRCSFCLKCIYGCPHKALIPGIGKFAVIKEGYNLNDIKKRVEGVESGSIEELAKGYLFKGVKEYLLDNE